MSVALWLAVELLPRTLGADQGGEGGYSFGFRAGGVHLPDSGDSTWTASLAFRGGLGSLIAYEVAAAYYPTEYGDGEVDEEVIAGQVSVLFYPLPSAGLRPYALAGAGALYVDTTFEGARSDEDDVVFGGHAGAGLDLELGRGAYLSADARWNFYGATDHLESEDLDFGQITIGLHFRFG